MFKPYSSLSKSELDEKLSELMKLYEDYKSKNLKLDMSRGKPGADQLSILDEMLTVIKTSVDCYTENGIDCRNYGLLDGIPEMKEIFSDLLEVPADNIILGGNSSLNMMFDTISRAMTNGILGSDKPWGKYDKVKFLCPAPGYDRHFAICQHFGIEMINIEMKSDGPDMDTVERLVSEDELIKGIWCVPMYSNPSGITYSDEVVRRFAALKPKAKDFRVFWDNAYCIHHLSDNPDKLLNIFDECAKNNSCNMILEFASTSKISFPGGGVAALAASSENIKEIKSAICIQTIGPDKLNQLRHKKYFKDIGGIREQMKKHREIIKPKFDMVLNTMENELGGLEIAYWNKPNGGYFISLDTLEGCAKRTLSLLKDSGVTMTPAGATYPYGTDKKDNNIRIAPTFPPVSELKTAMALFCVCVKIAAIEKLVKD